MTSHAYDALRRKTSETWDDGRVFSFTYDAAGQLLSASDPAATLSYTWDSLGQVTSETHSIAGLPDDVVLSQFHDAAGNRWQLSAQVGTNSDFVTVTGFNAANRPFDPANAIVADYDYAYDAAGRMTQVVLPAAI